jgi:polar amino acid transport system substrate-binding protein
MALTLTPGSLIVASAYPDPPFDLIDNGSASGFDIELMRAIWQPYLEFNQGVAINRRSTPNVASLADLRGLTAGIQSGNTSDIVARRLLAEGVIADIKYYPYHGIATALDDLEAHRIGLVIKLHPVISWLVKNRPALSVAIEVPTHEKLGIAFAKQNEALCEAVNRALAALRENGEFARVQARWFPRPAG